MWGKQRACASGAGERLHRYLLLAAGLASGSALTLAQVIVDPPSIDVRLDPGESIIEHKTVSIPGGTVDTMVDIYLLADTTGSMGPAIINVKQNAAAILNDIAGFIADVRFGVGDYKDFPNDNYCFRHTTTITSNHATVQQGINTWNASGGSDIPEGQLYALDRLATLTNIGWRSAAQKIIVWFGDAPGHDAVCAARSGLPYSITETSVIDKLIQGGFTVIAIGTTTGVANALNADPRVGANDYQSRCGTPGGAAGQANRIAAATNGVSFQDVPASQIAQAIRNAIRIVILDIDCELRASGNTALHTEILTPPYTGIVLPPAGQTLTLEFDVRFTGVPCTPDDIDGLFEGEVDVVVDGQIAAQQDVTIRQPACHNEQPICAAGGPYTVECQGGETRVQLSALGSSDPNDPGDTLSFTWSVDCPDAHFDDPHSPTPTLIIDTSSDCRVDCTATLGVTDTITAPVACTAQIRVRDTTAPTVSCPPNIAMLDANLNPGSPAYNWLHSATAADTCDAGVAPTVNAPASFPIGDTLVTWTAVDDCGNSASCSAVFTRIPPGNDDDRGSIGKVGSLLAYPYVILRWRDLNGDGSFDTNAELIENTFINIVNDDPDAGIDIKMYFVNGDPDLIEPQVGVHSGWLNVDVEGFLTRSNPTYWDAFTGRPGLGMATSPQSVPSWLVLDDGDRPSAGRPGRPDPNGSGDRVIRGFILAWAADASGENLKNWNRLSGSAVVINYEDASALEYPAWAFAMISGDHGDEFAGGLISFGELGVGGSALYDYSPGVLLLDFFADSGIEPNLALSRKPSGLPAVVTRSELTLQVLDADFANDDFSGPRTTFIVYDVHDQNEVGHSGAAECITCWASRPLTAISEVVFDLFYLGTARGKARIDGLAPEDAKQCDVLEVGPRPLLGLQIKTLEFDSGRIERSATGLVGEDKEAGYIRYATFIPPFGFRPGDGGGVPPPDTSGERPDPSDGAADGGSGSGSPRRP